MADQNGVARPKMTLGGEFDEGYGEFLGVVQIDAWEHGDRGWKWHLGVRPIDIAIQGETGCFHTWAKASGKENSVMGVQRIAMMQVFPPETEIGEGTLIGVGAWWKRDTLKFGTNKDGEEMKAEGVLIPLRLASKDEQERIAQHGGSGTTPASQAKPQAEATTAGTDEHLQDILALVEGKTRQQIQRAASSRDCTLPREIKQGLLSGALLKSLLDDGIVEENEGVLREKVPF